MKSLWARSMSAATLLVLSSVLTSVPSVAHAAHLVEIAVFEGHDNAVCCLAFRPDGSLLASGSLDKTVRVWDVGGRKQRMTLRGHLGPVLALAFTSEGRRLVSSSRDGTIRVWDLDSGKELRTIRGHRGAVNAMVLIPGTSTLASGGIDGVKMWDLQSGKPLGFMEGSDVSPVLSMAVTADGRSLATGHPDMTVRIWNIAAAKQAASLLHVGPVYCVALSADGRSLAAASVEKVRLWLLSAENKAFDFVLGSDGNEARAVAFSPDDRLLGAVGGKVPDKAIVRLWSRPGGQEKASVERNQAPLLALAFSPDNTIFATGGGDNQVRLWRLAAGAADQ